MTPERQVAHASKRAFRSQELNSHTVPVFIGFLYNIIFRYWNYFVYMDEKEINVR